MGYEGASKAWLEHCDKPQALFNDHLLSFCEPGLIAKPAKPS